MEIVILEEEKNLSRPQDANWPLPQNIIASFDFSRWQKPTMREIERSGFKSMESRAKTTKAVKVEN